MSIAVGLDNYLVDAVHGFYDEEHLKSQPFNISVRVELSSTVVDGKIGTTVDYAQLQQAVDAVVLNSEPIRLLETMAQRIAERIQSSQNVESVFVRIEKPKAPLPHPGGLPFIEYRWNR